MPVENSLQGEESEGRGLATAPDQQGSQLRATWRPPRLACRADSASPLASPASAVTADCAADSGDVQVAASATT
ncbi:MAG: hypothetical protein ACKPKO_58145, partial [Candidatus Fonsibacter sp.]